MRLALPAMLAICSVVILHAENGFGSTNVLLDPFDGAVIDESRWEVRRQGSATVTQKNAIHFDIPQGGDADITTLQIRIPVQGTARVDVVAHAPPAGGPSGAAYFQLSTNSAGTKGHMLVSDTYNFGFEIGFSASNMSFSRALFWDPPLPDGQSGVGQGFYTFSSNPLERQFRLLIARTSLSSASFSVFDLQGSLLAQSSMNVANVGGRPTPEELYVALGGYGRLSYDNLVLTGVPEPALAPMLAAFSMLAVRWRRHAA
jgi:hypothetical protein